MTNTSYYLFKWDRRQNKDNPYLFYRSKSIVPLVFWNLKKRFSINDACYLKSLTKFQLKLYLNACPCVYQTILTIKSTGPIYWFFLCLEFFTDQIYQYSHSALMSRLAMYSETEANFFMLKTPCLPLREVDTLY